LAGSIKLEFLVCEACERTFGLATIGYLTSERLPAEFEASCPHCATKWLYAKSAIQVIEL